MSTPTYKVRCVILLGTKPGLEGHNRKPHDVTITLKPGESLIPLFAHHSLGFGMDEAGLTCWRFLRCRSTKCRWTSPAMSFARYISTFAARNRLARDIREVRRMRDSYRRDESAFQAIKAKPFNQANEPEQFDPLISRAKTHADFHQWRAELMREEIVWRGLARSTA